MPTILKNVRLFTGAADLTGRANKLTISAEREVKQTTTWGDYDTTSGQVWETVKGGLIKTSLQGSGFWEAGDSGKVDDVSWTDLGGLSVWTACPHTADAGALAYLTEALRGNYQLLDKPGEVAPWEAAATGSWPLVRGVVLHPPGTARTATGTGAAVQHVAVGASETLYASLHVLSVAGTDTPTITVKIQSDDNSGFTSATDRLSFTAATAAGGQKASVAGAVTDTYWRVHHTVSGTNPSILYVVAIGVATT